MSLLRVRGCCAVGFVCLLANLAVGDPPTKKRNAAAPPSRKDSYGDPLPKGAIARLGTLRLRLQGRITSAAFLPDNKTVVAASTSGTGVRQWDTASGKEIGHHGDDLAQGCRILACSLKGEILAIAVNRNEVLLWDIDARKVVSRFSHSKGILHGVFVGEGKEFVSVGADAVVRWWDVRNGTMLRAWDPVAAERGKTTAGVGMFRECYRAVFSRDGETLVIANLWDRQDRNIRWTSYDLVVCHPGRKRKVWPSAGEIFSVSPDGKLVARVPRDTSAVSIIHVATGKELHVLKYEDGLDPDAVAFAQDNKCVAVMGRGQGGVRIWDLTKDKEAGRTRRRIVDGYWTAPHVLAFSPDGKRVLFPVGDTIAFLETGKGMETPFFNGHRHPVSRLHFSADGRQLLSGTGDNWRHSEETITWDTNTWKETGHSDLANPPPSGLPILSASPDQSLYLHLRKEDSTLYVHDRRTNDPRCRLDVSCDRLSIYGGFFSPSNRLVLLGTEEGGKDQERKVLLLDTNTGKSLGAIAEPDSFHPLAFSSDDTAVAWHHTDGTIEVAAVRTGKRLWRLGLPQAELFSSRIRALVFSPDGRYLAAWDNTAYDLFVWDLRRGRLHCRLPGKKRGLWNVSMAFSPDSRTLAVGAMGGGNNIQLWELATGKPRCEIKGHAAPVLALAFSPDGRILASGSADTTVLLWDLQALPRTKQQ